MRIVIPNYRARSRNHTTRKHWTVYRDHLDEATEFVRTYAPSRSVLSPARVVITAVFKSRPIDTSNIDDKIIVDALMKVGILKDDKPSENPEVVKRSMLGESDHLIIDVLPI